MEGLYVAFGVLGTFTTGLLGLVGVMWKGRNGKAHNPGNSAQLATLEALGHQMVGGLEAVRREVADGTDGIRSDLTDVKVVLEGMKTVVGGCETAQRFRGKG